MRRQDILLDDNNDYMIIDGDFFIENSDQQNIQLILLSTPGSWKQYPLVGASIKGDINGLFDYNMKNRIKQQLQNDGYSGINFNYNNGTGKINIVI